MPLSIKNPEAEQLARKLAQQTGETIIKVGSVEYGPSEVDRLHGKKIVVNLRMVDWLRNRQQTKWPKRELTRYKLERLPIL